MKLFIPLLAGLSLLTVSASVAHAQDAPKDWQYQVGPSADASRRQWRDLTTGTELARGRKVFFSPQPNYPLTTDAHDAYDLTSGHLSARLDDRVWFSKDAVGWYLGAGTMGGVLMIVDLGSPQAVGQIAIRVLGGKEQGILELPASIEFLASLDGKHYFTLDKMSKLMPAERAQSDFKTAFYVPEEGKPFMYPLFCREPVTARYVALRVTPESGLFADQISVLQAKPGTALKPLQSFPPARILTDGLAVAPRHDAVVVTTNLDTPSWLVISNNSGQDLTKDACGFRLELPLGLRVAASSKPAFNETPSSRPDMHVYQFTFGAARDQEGPLWIEPVPGVAVPPGARAIFTGTIDGHDSHSLDFPIRLVRVPVVPPLKGLDISLAWMSEHDALGWPNFLADFRKLGFGYVSTFPRWFGKDSSGNWDANSQKSLDFLARARAAGYGVVYNESPFHVMWDQVKADRTAGKIDPAEASQLYNQVDGKPGQWMCPLYRGKYYQDELARVARLAALVQPDQVYMDIEWWDPVVAESRHDPRVVAAWKASGKSWNDYITDVGAQVLGELVKGIRQAVPDRKLTIGLYDSDPRNRIYNSFFDFDKIYPVIIDIAQPSLYVQGRAAIVGARVGFDYQKMGSRNIIPWLSTGTYGEYDPRLTEPMVLETILHGARGLTYYWFGDFDPGDFIYHAKALSELAPYQALLASGKPLAYHGDNAELSYTCFASDREALLMVGNYNGAPTGRALLPLAPLGARHAQLVGGPALPIADGAATIIVPPHEFRLIHLTVSP